MNVFSPNDDFRTTSLQKTLQNEFAHPIQNSSQDPPNNTLFSGTCPFPLNNSLKGQCPDYAHARASSVFSSKDNRTVKLTRQDFLPDRTADRDLLFIFSSNILDFRRSLSSYIKNLARGSKTHRDFIASWAASRPENLVPLALKTYFLILKLVSEVNRSKSSNICLICSRSSLKRLKDINKNAISTL